MTRQQPYVDGNCFWYGYQILENADNVTSIMKSDLHRNKALIPPYVNMHSGNPKKVKNLTQVFTEDMHFLTWDKPKQPENPENARMYVVYRFRKGEKVNVNRAENILSVTRDNFYVLPFEGGDNKYTYAVTALDAFKNEGKMAKIKVKL